MISHPPKELQGLIMGAIKRVYRRSPVRLKVLKDAEVRMTKTNKDGTIAKKEAVFYVCSSCHTHAKSQRSKNHPQIHIDHIDPVIPVDRPLKSWQEFLDRLFCDIDNLQCLCDVCHSEKTQAENKLRREYKKSAKLR